jgi:PAS domain S-box-containing protein
MKNKTKPDKSGQAESLRKSAEEHLRKAKAKAVKGEAYGNMQKLMQELQVHQIELEMQNEELRKTQQKLQTSRDNYFDFYNLSPVGYFTFDEKGLILDLNLISATLLSIEKRKLISKNFRPYVAPDFRPSFNAFCKKVFETDVKQTCELKLNALTHVLMEGISVPDTEGHGKRIRAVMVDITERKEMEERLKQGKEMFEKAMKGIFHVLVSMIEKRSSQTPNHRQRVVTLACAIAKEMDISEGCIDGIYMAGSILDLGYISVPVDILSKPTGLSEIESQILKTHPQVGYDILKDVEFPWPVAKIVLQHHERIDGSGYPYALKGDDILTEAKILTVADTVEEICCPQSYRQGLGIDKALEEIAQNKGILYDAKVVDACIKLFREKGFRFE